MTDGLQELYQEVILDHSRNPRNFQKVADANRVVEGFNPLCGDRFTVFVRLENDVIREIGFQGSGCAISKAAASMMTAFLKGKTVSETRQLFQEFRALVTTGAADSVGLGKLAAFAGVHKFPARVKCAILPWHAVATALEGQTTAASTESNDT
jgi:nitrogen fixation protein NifU and related proteins